MEANSKDGFQLPCLILYSTLLGLGIVLTIAVEIKARFKTDRFVHWMALTYILGMAFYLVKTLIGMYNPEKKGSLALDIGGNTSEFILWILFQHIIFEMRFVSEHIKPENVRDQYELKLRIEKIRSQKVLSIILLIIQLIVIDIMKALKDENIEFNIVAFDVFDGLARLIKLSVDCFLFYNFFMQLYLLVQRKKDLANYRPISAVSASHISSP